MLHVKRAAEAEKQAIKKALENQAPEPVTVPEPEKKTRGRKKKNV